MKTIHPTHNNTIQFSFGYQIPTVSHFACSREHSIFTISFRTICTSAIDVDNNRSSRFDSSSNRKSYMEFSHDLSGVSPNSLEFVSLPRNTALQYAYQFQNSVRILRCNLTCMQRLRRIAYQNEDRLSTSLRR